MSTQSDRLLRFGYTMLGFCAALGLLSLLQGTPVQAQAPGVNLTTLNNQVQALSATVMTLQNTVNTQATKITTLQTQTQYLSTGTDENGYPATFLTRCNVWVQNGSGATEDISGLGNLIIGYNETGNTFQGDVRTGSHILILGTRNSYNNCGGLVAGESNANFGPFDSVSGGCANIASNDGNSVSGGYLNAAIGLTCSVGGGYLNGASDGSSSVSGGYLNAASTFCASVSGGENITTSGSGYYYWAAGSYHSP